MKIIRSKLKNYTTSKSSDKYSKRNFDPFYKTIYIKYSEVKFRTVFEGTSDQSINLFLHSAWIWNEITSLDLFKERSSSRTFHRLDLRIDGKGNAVGQFSTGVFGKLHKITCSPKRIVNFTGKIRVWNSDAFTGQTILNCLTRVGTCM